MIWWASQGKYNDGIQYFFSCCTRTWRSCRTSASMTRLGSSLDSRNRWSTCTTRWVCNKDAEPTEANFFFCSSWSWSFIARPKPSFFFLLESESNYCCPAETNSFFAKLLFPGWNRPIFGWSRSQSFVAVSTPGFYI